MFVAVCAVFVLAVIGAWQFYPRTAVSPPVEEQQQPPISETDGAILPDTTGTPPKTASRSTQYPLPLAKSDIVASWDFKGAYSDRPDLVAKAEAEIARLSDLIGKGTYSDTILYVSIANQYGLMGNGKQEYDYLGRAIQADANGTTGLPWHNLGVLIERLGAYETARVAYEKATLIQPGLKQWQYAYLEFLTSRMKDNATAIERAFTAAEKDIGQDAYLLQLRADWEKS
jgi:tetratricopeptide (TPR) repeat protein